MKLSTKQKVALLNNEDWSLEIKTIERIKNLVYTGCQEAIVLTSEEEKLIDKIHNTNYEKLPTLTQDIIEYINNTRICPYIERKQLLSLFYNKFFL
jgi:trans-aconitate methyltransferase